MTEQFEIEYSCCKCGWKRPRGWSTTKCGKCGAPLKRKLVKSKDPNDEKKLLNVLSQPCEKAVNGECQYASDNCFKNPPYDPKYWRTIPSRRWIDCYGYKRSLNLTFIRQLGIYHLTRCPLCDLDLVQALMKNLKQKTLEETY